MFNRLAGYPLIEGNPYKFLPYTEEMKIGPTKTERSILLQVTFHTDVLKVLSTSEIAKQLSDFTDVLYSRIPKFNKGNYRITYRQVNMRLLAPRIIFIVKYTNAHGII